MGHLEATTLADVVFEHVLMAIGASDPEVIVGDVPDEALVVAPAPARGLDLAHISSSYYIMIA